MENKNRKNKDRLFGGLLFGAISFSVVMLIVMLFQIVVDGVGGLDWHFISSMPSSRPENAGILSAIVGSLWTIAFTTIIALPVGIGTAIYLEEYGNRKSRFYRFITLNISNLAGVPSIVYGILGLAVFVRGLGFGKSIIAGALTLAIMILPTIIVTSREALKSVPSEIKHGAYALGFTKWKTTTSITLPFAMTGILTGCILAISRAIGEAAPLIMVGAAGYIAYLPRGIFDSYTVLPIQIFNWTSRPQIEFKAVASAGILLLMIILLLINSTAIILRNKYQKKMD